MTAKFYSPGRRSTRNRTGLSFLPIVFFKQIAKMALTVSILLNLSFSAKSQEKTAKIDGIIGDEAKKPLSSATVILLDIRDSSTVKQTVSDKLGHFQFDHIPEGRYQVRANSVGRSPVNSPVFELTAPSLTLDGLFLHAVSKELAAVSVIATRPFFEQKADKMIINVDASPVNAGSTAMDVLERSPGITVDKDDNISLKGKQGVKIMIDNRPTYMSSAQLASYLKSLPASTIDQIELMTNPSSKYDAAGNAGIINIKTKKIKAYGFNGSVTVSHSQGIYGKPGASLNLNYRDGKANFFLNAGISHGESFRSLDIMRKYLDTTPDRSVNSIFSQHTTAFNVDPNFNVKFGMDYYLNSRTTVGFVLSGFSNAERSSSSSNIFLEDPNSVVDSIVYSPSTIHSSWRNGSVNLNLRQQFDSMGTELTTDADYIRYSSSSDQYFDNITYSPAMTKNGETVLTGHLPSDIAIYSFKSDYTHPFSKTLKFEGGIKSSYVTTDNTAGYFNVVNNFPEVDTTKTNHFLYRENINAAYLALTREYKKWNIQIGLRYENTNYSGHQLGNGTLTNKDSSFSNSYGSLFPTLFISYQANKTNQFTVNYGRRIDRPAYEDLNPFLFFLDQYTYQAGNPYLQPQFSQNIEFSHTYKNFLTTTLNYSYTNNYFTETFEQDGHATIVRKGNIGSRQNEGIAVSAQLHPAKWWTSILYSNLNYTKFDGFLYGENINVGAATVLMNLNNQLSFKNGWGAELSGYYRTKGVEGQIVVDPRGQASAALSKKLFHDKANVKLGIRDIFYTDRTKGSIDFQQTEASFQNARDSRQVSVALTYRFGKPLKSNTGRRGNGARDEQNRVNAGGDN
jgi:iron complex outermembrane receptor protein